MTRERAEAAEQALREARETIYNHDGLAQGIQDRKNKLDAENEKLRELLRELTSEMQAEIDSKSTPIVHEAATLHWMIRLEQIIPKQDASKQVPDLTISDECKHCGEDQPEWSSYANCWIHRRPSVDKRCTRKVVGPMCEALSPSPTPAQPCEHKRTSGGNDYLTCDDCGQSWDYRAKPSPDSATPKEEQK